MIYFADSRARGLVRICDVEPILVAAAHTLQCVWRGPKHGLVQWLLNHNVPVQQLKDLLALVLFLMFGGIFADLKVIPLSSWKLPVQAHARIIVGTEPRKATGGRCCGRLRRTPSPA